MFVRNANSVASILDPKTRFTFQPGDAESIAKAEKLALEHAEAYKAAITRRLGRAPTDAELQLGRIEHADTRSIVEKMADDAWQTVKVAKPSGHRLDKHIRDLQGGDDELAAAQAIVDPRQRQVAIMKAMRRRDFENADAAAEAAERKAAHLESVAESVAAVEGIRERLNWTEGATVSDLLTCDKALAQLRDVDGCQATASMMVAQVKLAELQRNGAAVSAAQEKLAAAQEEVARVASLEVA